MTRKQLEDKEKLIEGFFENLPRALKHTKYHPFGGDTNWENISDIIGLAPEGPHGTLTPEQQQYLFGITMNFVENLYRRYKYLLKESQENDAAKEREKERIANEDEWRNPPWGRKY
jgi:hypothetical protein